MFDFTGKRYIFFGFSIVLTIIGIIALFINGLQYDIKFDGGTIIKIQMADNNYDDNEVSTAIKDTIGITPITQKLQTIATGQTDEVFLLQMKFAKKDALTDPQINQIIEKVKSDFNVKSGDPIIEFETVTPSIGDEYKQKGLLAVVISSILIILYVWPRFSVMSGLSAALMAVVALVHDVFIMISVYAIFKIPVNESFIAAVLTILGYSINDTIIVYDRIRENSKLIRKSATFDLVNRSISQTLTRSINTIATTLIAVVTVYIAASIANIGSLKEFTFPLIIGIVSGCYSSIFVASPLWAMWKEFKAKKRIRRHA